MAHIGQKQALGATRLLCHLFRPGQLPLHLLQFSHGIFQFLILLNRIFKGGEKQVDDLHAV